MKKMAISIALASTLLGPIAWAESYPADNTGTNVRDRGNTLTSGDQAENQADRTITQQVRKAVVADESLSTNAHNVKIITVDGVVTLRGPVKDQSEKNTIASLAGKAAGVRRVDNHLEVAR
jgi:osmotically-inducible protein OsmY